MNAFWLGWDGHFWAEGTAAGRGHELAELDGGGCVETDTVAPFSLEWQNVPAGSYPFTATATDNDGGVKTSAGVPITVQ